jgi:hypothetical protein
MERVPIIADDVPFRVNLTGRAPARSGVVRLETVSKLFFVGLDSKILYLFVERWVV